LDILAGENSPGKQDKRAPTPRWTNGPTQGILGARLARQHCLANPLRHPIPPLSKNRRCDPLKTVTLRSARAFFTKIPRHSATHCDIARDIFIASRAIKAHHQRK
jgi:hypothetical protein